jgi:phage shock protein PspC (stress-responsive transcriptional regulator)
MSTFGDTAGHDTAAEEPTRQDGGANQPFSQSLFNRPQQGALGRPPLRRAYQGRMISGVCAGIADYLGVDVTIVRVVFAVLTFVGGAGIPAYLACLLLIPEEGSDESIASALIDSVQHRR